MRYFFFFFSFHTVAKHKKKRPGLYAFFFQNAFWGMFMITDFFMYNERMSKSVSYVDLGSCQLSWGEKGKKGKMSHELGTELLTLKPRLQWACRKHSPWLPSPVLIRNLLPGAGLMEDGSALSDSFCFLFPLLDFFFKGCLYRSDFCFLSNFSLRDLMDLWKAFWSHLSQMELGRSRAASHRLAFSLHACLFTSVWLFHSDPLWLWLLNSIS